MLKKVSLSLSLKGLSEALQIPQPSLMALCRDGRTMAAFVGEWAKRQFSMDRAADDILIRVLTPRGVNFIPSKNHGVGRSASASDLVEQFDKFNRVVVGDVAYFPTVHLYLLPTGLLKQWFLSGRLDKNGLTRREFLELFDLEEKDQLGQP